MLSKHDPSKMSRFFHGRSFTVDGLPIHFRHMNVYNTNAGNVIPEKEDFIPEKMILSTPNNFLAENIQSNYVKYPKTNVEPMQGGGGGVNIFTILPSRYSNLSIFFFNQANPRPSYKWCEEEKNGH